MTLRIVFFLVVLAAQSAVAQGPSDREVAAIKAVIALETESFMSLDQKTWADTWLQVPYAYWSYTDKAESNFVDGWENIQKTFESYFTSQKPARSRITNVWREVRVYGTGAYVRFTQRVEDEMDTEESSQVRVLEKKDGKWKIVCMNSIAMTKKP